MPPATRPVLVVVAAACAVPGVFLVLRRMALVSDAIGHVLLLGIVLAYFVTRDLDSPWLLVGAALAGLLTVALVETAAEHQAGEGRRGDRARLPGAVRARRACSCRCTSANVHLDVDAVLLGQPENADRAALASSFGVADSAAVGDGRGAGV